jgi:hypothetical protein
VYCMYFPCKFHVDNPYSYKKNANTAYCHIPLEETCSEHNSKLTIIYIFSSTHLLVVLFYFAFVKKYYISTESEYI